MQFGWLQSYRGMITESTTMQCMFCDQPKGEKQCKLFTKTNLTFFCSPSRSNSMYYFTQPTKDPSRRPTPNPSRFPTKFPTREPTRDPTREVSCITNTKCMCHHAQNKLTFLFSCFFS